jgi:hypothetical protein
MTKTVYGCAKSGKRRLQLALKMVEMNMIDAAHEHF